ncbi:MAG TPA: radical SAM protein [Methanotrichaceae archaeon]|nr:radical SAM protein [Methanotrichaceae archaeon]HQF16365.1 radical SAM protein [Methanotrichaceae archaeon]HQI91021.1 radical SAM protein [Methanotrichaceae archaeon]
MIEFRTKNGNMYAWDNEVGLFIPFSHAMRGVLNKISNHNPPSREEVIWQLKNEFPEEDVEFCYDWLNKWNRIKLKKPNYPEIHDPDKGDIEKYLLKRGFTQLLLGVTEDCNLRCKYCIYSDFYKHSRGYSEKYMNFFTAKKAIDNYFSLLEMGKRFNPLRRPTIGFYGGEPLLNFKLIEKCVDYIEQNYYKTMFVMTTNGCLLDEEKAKWLMKHDFMIIVSLDGPEQEHNRNRIYANGRGTFKDIMKNIRPIMKADYKKIYSLPVYDWRTDILKQEEFFNLKDIPQTMAVSQVSDYAGSEYYDQFTEEDRVAHFSKIEEGKIQYYQNLDHHRFKEKNTPFDALFGTAPGNELFGSISIFHSDPIRPFTSACIPGTKIFVDVDGIYHLCERVPYSFPIGNVDEGLNLDKIIKLIINYNKAMNKCEECKVSRKCNFCYQMFMTDCTISNSSEVCNEIETLRKNSFSSAFSIAEKFPDFIENSNPRHMNIKKYR